MTTMAGMPAPQPRCPVTVVRPGSTAKAPATESQGPQASGGSGGSPPRASTAKAPATEAQGPQASGGPPLRASTARPRHRPAAQAAGPVVEMARMHAQVGYRLIVGEDRIGEVVGIPSADGSPPYIIKWLKDGHIAMVFPDQYARVVPGPQKNTQEPGVTA